MLAENWKHHPENRIITNRLGAVNSMFGRFFISLSLFAFIVLLFSLCPNSQEKTTLMT